MLGYIGWIAVGYINIAVSVGSTTVRSGYRSGMTVTACYCYCSCHMFLMAAGIGTVPDAAKCAETVVAGSTA
jgi:hypothetical protein